MTAITFFVPGRPRPGGSKRGFLHKTTKRIIMVDMADNKDWKVSCRAAAQEAYSGPLLEGPLGLAVVFQVLRPKGDFGSGRNAGKLTSRARLAPTVKPDATKLLRCLEDALTGIVWRDDAQIVDQHVRKVYADKQGALVRVYVPDWCKPATLSVGGRQIGELVAAEVMALHIKTGTDATPAAGKA